MPYRENIYHPRCQNLLGFLRGDLADLLIGDMHVAMLLISVSATYFIQFLISLGFEMLVAEWAIGSAHSLSFLAISVMAGATRRERHVLPRVLSIADWQKKNIRN